MSESSSYYSYSYSDEPDAEQAPLTPTSRSFGTDSTKSGIRSGVSTEQGAAAAAAAAAKGGAGSGRTEAALLRRVTELEDETKELRRQLKKTAAAAASAAAAAVASGGGGGERPSVVVVEAIELKAVLQYKLSLRVTPEYVDLVHRENHEALKEVADVKDLLLRTLVDLKSKRRPERKRRLENKIENLKLEKATLKNQRNEFVVNCNELGKIYEDMNRLEKKLSAMKRRLRRLLRSRQGASELASKDGARLLRMTRSLIVEHGEMMDTVKAFEKGRVAAQLELAKYLVEVACLLDAEVKMRGFEELIDEWKETYNIPFESAEYLDTYYGSSGAGAETTYVYSSAYPEGAYPYESDYPYGSYGYSSYYSGDYSATGEGGDDDESYYSYSYTRSGGEPKHSSADDGGDDDDDDESYYSYSYTESSGKK